MNIYRHTFPAVCPADGNLVVYRLEIQSSALIHVEHIKAATALIRAGWHAQIADHLADTLGGDQTISQRTGCRDRNSEAERMIHYHGTPVGSEREDAANFLAGRHAR
jgi:hypothetical protein